MINLAEDSRLRVRAISSRQPLASLSTRTGRFRSRSKETLQRLRTCGGGGGGGAVTVTEVFAAQVARTPDAVAIVDDRTSLTYQQLDERSTRLAAVLGLP